MRLVVLIIVFVLLMSSHNEANAQFAFTGGVNYSFLRTEDIIRNKEKEPITSWNVGAYLIWYPISGNDRFSLKNEGYFYTAGYNQQLDNLYRIRFTYFNASVQANYSLHKFISVQTGIYIGGLVKTTPKNILETYNEFDFGFVAGISFFENKRVGVFTRFTYGVMPILTYPKMDEFGNFLGEIKGLKNTNLCLGTFINLYNEKIKFGL